VISIKRWLNNYTNLLGCKLGRDYYRSKLVMGYVETSKIELHFLPL